VNTGDSVGLDLVQTSTVTLGVRSAAMAAWDVVSLGRQIQDRPWLTGERGRRTWCEIRSLCAYAVEVWSRRRRTPMDVRKMVALWVPIVKGLATAHSKEELDHCEFELDRCLAPLLTAPVRQIREFYVALVQALKTDPAVPFFVWSAFDAWHEVILKRAPDEDVVRLKKALAGEIAALVEEDVRPDIGSAIRGALQWRPAQQLEQVRDALKGGAKPKLVGRESCLFLQVGEAQVML